MCAVRLVKNALIRMRDGINLAGDLYLPDSEGSFPSLLVYFPYHKDDWGGKGNVPIFNFFAQRGYACAIVDVRGTGASEGQTTTAMSRAEQQDGYEVVEWMAKQPWCNGKVGMWGASYPGFTSLQVAALKPPHLVAIVPLVADVDLYLGFAYPGGCLNALQLCGGYGPFMMVNNSMPTLYFDEGKRWKKVWDEHLKKNEPWLLSWLKHPLKDNYWKEPSILEAIEQIEVPVFAIGGWRDIFPSAPLLLFERLKSPKKILVGPWVHGRPDSAPPPPNIDYLDHMAKWWDYWLKGEKNGIMNEAAVTVYVQGSGRWRSENSLSSGSQDELQLYLGEGRLVERAPEKEFSLRYSTDNTVGLSAGMWSPFSLDVGLPLDQRSDDAYSLSFDSQPLEKGVEILGSPTAELFCSFSSPKARLVAKLNDMSPEGSSVLITTGWLNMEHELNHERSNSLEAGKAHKATIALSATSYHIAKGHRIRLSISGSDFPRIWPSTSNPQIDIHQSEGKRSTVTIPVVRGEGVSPPTFSPPRLLGPVLPPTRTSWKILHEPVSSMSSMRIEIRRHVPMDPFSDLYNYQEYEARTRRGDPSSTVVTSYLEYQFKSSKMSMVAKGNSRVANDGVNLSLEISVDRTPYFTKSWSQEGVA